MKTVIRGMTVAALLWGGLPTICKEGSRTHEYACCVG